ncbi:MAG: SDR family oxidoreductase, partial [Planctomycetes bacterium]|nr:SDR family oxidoreductase [Planctomycetota bacterium]
TGASRGIGYAAAERLLASGAKVAIASSNQERISKAAQDLGCTGLVCDMADLEAIPTMVSQAKEALGGLNVLINNAAIGYFAPLSELDPQRFEALFRINVTASMVAAQHASKIFMAQKHGDIINVSSTAGKRGYAGGSAYSASKFALGAMTECWRAELRPYNVRVATIHPSEVQTTFARAHDAEIGSNPTKLVAEDIAIGIESMIALPSHAFVTDMTIWATNPQV